MEFTVELFKCHTCEHEHMPEELVDVLILPPADRPQVGTPFALCGGCVDVLMGTDQADRVIVMDLH